MTAQNNNEQQENLSEDKGSGLFENELIAIDYDVNYDGDIIISPARGTYAASLGEPSNLEWVQKYFDPNRKSYPDIDLNFNQTDRDWITEYLKGKNISSLKTDLPE